MNRLAFLAFPSLLLTTAASAQVVITANTTTDTVTAFSPVDGSLVNSNLFPIAASGGTKVSAIAVGNEIWVSEQIGDRIVRHDVAGNVLGVIGPTFPGGGLDNPRGMTVISGLVYVANDAGGNGALADSLNVFDPAGNFITRFALSNTTSPYSVIDFEDGLLVASGLGAEDLHRYSYFGASLGTFHDSGTIAFAHQVSRARDGHVWVAAFTTGQVFKLNTANGAVLTAFPASGARGVYELWNGNVLWSNGSGVHVFDVATSTSTLVLAGGSAHFGLLGGAGAPSVTHFGSGCSDLVLGANGVPQLGNASFALLLSNVNAVSPVGLFAFGSSALNPGIDLTAIGMPGCAAYQSLDIGLLTGSATTNGVSTFPLPIPNSPALTGSQLAAQGVAFAVTAPLPLAASNGVLLVL